MDAAPPTGTIPAGAIREGVVAGRVVLGGGIVAVLAILWSGPGSFATATAGVALAVIGFLIVRQDLSTFLIPDWATFAFGIVGLAARWSEAMQAGEAPAPALGLAALDALICGGALLTLRELHFRRRGYDGIGLGDVKLAAAGGILVGTVGFAWAVFGASLVGLAIAFRSRRAAARGGPPAEAVSGRQSGSATEPGHEPVIPPRWVGHDPGDRIAFGALLVPAFWLTWLLSRGVF